MSEISRHPREALEELRARTEGRRSHSPHPELSHLAELFFARYHTQEAQLAWLSDRPYGHSRGFMILQGWGIPQMIEELETTAS